MGWGAFLAMSWTWCIGMYLPVLLVRDFGFWGWVAFAVPNVLGAAAMGRVLARPGASEGVVRRHGPACVAFSVVTILFHALFVAWVVSGLVGPTVAIGGACAATLAFLLAGRAWRAVDAVDTVAALALFAASAVTFLALAAPQFRFPPVGSPLPPGVGWLALVCVFGFALCPYLDLTFHRARQATAPATGAAAFALGFGVFFLLMIVFTLWYARLLVPGAPWPRGRVAWAVAAHMILQAGFTVAVHVRAMRAMPGQGTDDDSGGLGTLAGCLFALLPLAAVLVFTRAGGYRGMEPFEIGYRLFLAYYGLVFPAYVWVCMVPRRHIQLGPTRGQLVVLALAVLAAAPMFWMAFIERRYGWLGPGLAVVLLARFVAPRGVNPSSGAGTAA